ncbi:hypothetical protein DFAR_1390021 [Desulfarculales bacterium]
MTEMLTALGGREEVAQKTIIWPIVYTPGPVVVKLNWFFAVNR